MQLAPPPLTRRHGLRTIRLAAALVVVAACADYITGTQSSGPSAHAIQLVTPIVSVGIGDTVQLTAAVLDQNGAAFATLPAGVRVAWSVTNPVRATVDTTGRLIGKRAGGDTVTATVNTDAGPVSVSAGFVVRSQPATVGRADTVTLAGTVGAPLADSVRLRVADANGDAVPSIWVRFAAGDTSDGAVAPDSALTDTAGLVALRWTLGRTARPDTVTATVVGGSRPLTATVIATARADVAQTVALAPDTVRFATLGRTSTVTPSYRDRFGNATTFSGRLAWSSSAPAVATVDSAGSVKAVGNGSAWIHAAGTGLTAESTLVVVRQLVATVAVTLGRDSIAAGDTTRASAVARDSAGASIGDAVSSWRSSNGAVATVDSTGLVTAVAAGADTIVAKSGGVQGSASLRVTAGATAPSYVNMQFDGSLTRIVGEQVTIPVNVIQSFPGGFGGTPVGGRTVTFRASDTTTVFTPTSLVTPADGSTAQFTVTLGKRAGVDTIFASSPGAQTATQVFTLGAGAGVGVVAQPATLSLAPNDTATVRLVAVDQYGNVANQSSITGLLGYAIDVPNVVHVDSTTSYPSVRVVALGGGTTHLTIATRSTAGAQDSLSATSTITVSGAPRPTITGIVFTPTPVTIRTPGDSVLVVVRAFAGGTPVRAWWTFTVGASSPVVQIASAKDSIVWLRGISNGQGYLTARDDEGTQDSVLVIVGSSGGAKTWTGATSTDWGTASNWSPPGVPGASDTVVVNVGATNNPVLSTSTQIAGIRMDSGAALVMYGNPTLTVTGDVAAGSPAGFASAGITGTGIVAMTGRGASLRGIVPVLDIAGGSVTLSGRTATYDSLTLESGALTMNGWMLDVTGSMSLDSTSTLTMQNPRDSLIVQGDAYFGGSREAGLLTAGTVIAEGDFAGDYTDSTAFVASGTHTVVMVGTNSGGLSFGFLGTYPQADSWGAPMHFANVVVEGAYETTAITAIVDSMYVQGKLNIQDQLAVNRSFVLATGEAHGSYLKILGDLQTTEGTTFDPQQVELAGTTGTRNVRGNFAPGNTYVTSQTPWMRLAGGIDYGFLTIDNGASPQLVGGGVRSTALEIRSGSLQFNGWDLTVDGYAQIAGSLIMKYDSDLLTVGSSLWFRGTVAQQLSAGQIIAHGRVDIGSTAYGTSGGYAPTGTHTLVLAGQDTLTIDGTAPSGPQSSLFHVVVDSGANALLQGDAAGLAGSSFTVNKGGYALLDGTASLAIDTLAVRDSGTFDSGLQGKATYCGGLVVAPTGVVTGEFAPTQSCPWIVNVNRIAGAPRLNASPTPLPSRAPGVPTGSPRKRPAPPATLGRHARPAHVTRAPLVRPSPALTRHRPIR